MAKSTSNGNGIADLSKDWRRLQQQKSRLRGGVEARILTELSMYFGEHGIVQVRESLQTRALGKDEDLNRLNLVFNMLKKAARKKMGNLYRSRPDFAATPNKQDPKAFDQADVVSQLVRATDFKCQERLQHWRRIWWCVLGGVVIEHTPWVEASSEEPIPAFDPQTNELLWRDQQDRTILPQSQVELAVKAGIPPERFDIVEHLATVGDVGSEIVSPLNFFIDSSVRLIRELGPKQRCYIAEVKTHDWIRDIFGSDAADALTSRSGDELSVVKTKLLDRGPSLASMNLRDLIPGIQGTKQADDPPMAVVLTGYEPDCEDYPHGRRVIFVPDQAILDDDEMPYSELPCTDLHFDAPTVSFWTPSFLTDGIPAQKFLNKRWSQTGEAANATIHEILLLGGELTKEDLPTDIPGVVEDGISEEGQPRVVALQRSPLPEWFLESIKEVASFLTGTLGSDIMQHQQFPGQLRGPLSLPILQELVDSEDAPFYEHMGEQLAQIKQQRINRVKAFYPPIRTLHYTGKTMKDEVLIFHNEEVLRSGTDFTITVDQSTLLPELSAMRRARVVEDLSGPLAILYTDPRTGKLDPSRIAMAVKYTDRGLEDRHTKYRRLAQHMISRLWEGESLSQSNPEIPYPFWDHNVMLDEYENAMNTTEWLEASQAVKHEFLYQYEQHRQFLAATQQAQMDSVQGQMYQGVMHMAAQQAAAKAASVATDAALSQIQVGEQMTQSRQQPPGAQGPIESALAQRMGANRMLPTGRPPVGPAGPRRLGSAPAGIQ